MSAVTAESLTVNETVPPRSRTFAPEVVAQIDKYLKGTPVLDGDGTPVLKDGEIQWETAPVRSLGVGTFEKESAARSALHTLNRLLKEQHGHETVYSGTVRQTEDSKFRAILLNKPAKKVERKAKPQAATPKPAAPKPQPTTRRRAA